MDKTCRCSLGRREGKNFKRAVHALHSIDSVPSMVSVHTDLTAVFLQEVQ